MPGLAHPLLSLPLCEHCSDLIIQVVILLFPPPPLLLSLPAPISATPLRVEGVSVRPPLTGSLPHGRAQGRPAQLQPLLLPVERAGQAAGVAGDVGVEVGGEVVEEVGKRIEVMAGLEVGVKVGVRVEGIHLTFIRTRNSSRSI